MPVCASRQLETIFSGNRVCWERKESGIKGQEFRLGMQRVCVCVHTQVLTHWGALEQFILGEVFAEDKATISTNRPGLLYFHHELMVFHTPL